MPGDFVVSLSFITGTRRYQRATCTRLAIIHAAYVSLKTKFAGRQQAQSLRIDPVLDRKDPFRPTWSIRSPSGQLLTVEFDRLRSHWRVTLGE